MAKILYVEDMRPRMEWMSEFFEGIEVKWVRTAERALQQLRATEFDAVFLDHDLSLTENSGEGMQVALYLADTKYPGIVVVHSANTQGGPAMALTLNSAGVNVYYGPAIKGQGEAVWTGVCDWLRTNK